MVMSGVLYVGIGILLVVFMALIGIALNYYFREEEKPEDDPFILNFMSQRTNGHAYGLEKAAQRTTSGRWNCSFDPKDVRPKDIIKNLWKPQEVVVDYDKVVTLPKGMFSKHKNVKIYLPQNAEDLTPALKDTSFGKMLMLMIEKQNLDKTIQEMLREGTKRRDDLLKELGDGELSAEWLTSIKTLLVEDIKTSIMKAGKDTHSFPSHNPAGG